ncbi:MAG: Hpt domain-containing protein [Caulobacteraceae bacterium]
MSDPAFPAPAKPTIPGPGGPRAGSRFGRIDPEAIAKAEAALKGLSSQFGQWLEDEVSKLEAARAAVGEHGLDRSTANQLYTHAHDLKGLGTTYDFPIITQIAGSLCRLLGDADARLRAPLDMIDAHIAAIRTCVQTGIKTTDDPAGRGFVEALEAQVSQHAQAL